VRLLAFALALSLALADSAFASPDEPKETPIAVPSPIPVGFLIAWKPTLLSVRIDSGAGTQFGSDKLQLLRGLGRYTTTLFDDQLMARAELEGGQFQSDTQGSNLGSNGVDLTARLLGGTATRISPGFIITASAGLITRYQWGTQAQGGAPRAGIWGLSTNIELEYRLAPLFTVSAYLEGALAPFTYAAQPNLGVLSDASEVRARLQLSVDVGPRTAIDLGYDFTRWHASFSRSSVLDPAGAADKALLLEAREHAIAFGVRWKP
jgi:hypothetical protein